MHFMTMENGLEKSKRGGRESCGGETAAARAPRRDG